MRTIQKLVISQLFTSGLKLWGKENILEVSYQSVIYFRIETLGQGEHTGSQLSVSSCKKNQREKEKGRQFITHVHT